MIFQGILDKAYHLQFVQHNMSMIKVASSHVPELDLDGAGPISDIPFRHWSRQATDARLVLSHSVN